MYEVIVAKREAIAGSVTVGRGAVIPSIGQGYVGPRASVKTSTSVEETSGARVPIASMALERAAFSYMHVLSSVPAVVVIAQHVTLGGG